MLLHMHHRPTDPEKAQEVDKLLVLDRLVCQAVVHKPDVIAPVAGTLQTTLAIDNTQLP